MLDRLVLRHTRPILESAAVRLAQRGITANQVTFAGFCAGMLALPCIINDLYLAGLVLLGVNRLADGVDGTLARQTAPTDAGAFLDIVLDFIVYAAVVLAFALADPMHNALPSAVLLTAFIGTATSFLAFAILAERRGLPSLRLPDKGFYYLGGLTEGTETFLFFAGFCLLPDHFPLLALFFAALCLLTTCMRVAFAWRVLRR